MWLDFDERDKRRCTFSLEEELLWIIVMFLSDSHSDGTHSLQSIHCWDTDAMLHFSKSDEETNSSTSRMTRGWAHFQLIFIFGWTILSMRHRKMKLEKQQMEMKNPCCTPADPLAQILCAGRSATLTVARAHNRNMANLSACLDNPPSALAGLGHTQSFPKLGTDTELHHLQPEDNRNVFHNTACLLLQRLDW